MKLKRLCRYVAAGSALAALALCANTYASDQSGNAGVAAVNPNPSNYAGLVGTNRDDADKSMGKLGFKMKKPANEDRGSLWWNGATKECVELQGKNGKVKGITATSTSRCQ